MRTNELDIGLWLIKTEGDVEAALAMDATLGALKGHWLVRETIGYLRRTFSRLDVTSRSLFALVEEGSCFAGSLMELALACDRIYHLALPGGKNRAPEVALSAANFGDYPMASGQSRLGRRFYDEKPALEALKANIGRPLDAEAAFALGLATSIPDDIDWADEIRIAVEERASMSPDALDCARGEPALRRSGDFGHPRLRPPHRLAELDLPAPQRGRRQGRAQGLRQGRKSRLRLEPGVADGFVRPTQTATGARPRPLVGAGQGGGSRHAEAVGASRMGPLGGAASRTDRLGSVSSSARPPAPTRPHKEAESARSCLGAVRLWGGRLMDASAAGSSGST